MPPTPQSTAIVALPSVTSSISDKPTSQQPSIPAMVILALFSCMMAALAVGVVLRQRKDTAAFRKRHENLGIPVEKRRFTRPSWLPRFKPRSMSTAAADRHDEDPTAVGALHAASVLLAAAPCQVFSSPMAMHFRIPLQGKTILILGAPWFPAPCGAQHCGAPTVRVQFLLLLRLLEFPE